MTQLTPSVTVEELAKAQTKAVSAERRSWKSAGAEYCNVLWYGLNGQPCLLNCWFPIYAIMTHGKDHVSKGGMVDSIDQHWYTQGFSNYAQNFTNEDRCTTRQQYEHRIIPSQHDCGLYSVCKSANYHRLKRRYHHPEKGNSTI